VTGPSNSRLLPSGRVIVILGTCGKPVGGTHEKGAARAPWKADLAGRSAVAGGSSHVARSAGVSAGHLFIGLAGDSSSPAPRRGASRCPAARRRAWHDPGRTPGPRVAMSIKGRPTSLDIVY